MDLQLRGKRALVTGSTAGIGFAAVAGLFREGASVIINGRTPQQSRRPSGRSVGWAATARSLASQPTCPPPRA